MANRVVQLDLLFRALADPTRRAVLARLEAERAVPVSELAAPFELALPTFLAHLAVLEQAGLVTTKKVGRVRTVLPVPRALEPAEGWLSSRRAQWERRLDALDALLLSRKRKQENQT